MKQYTHFILSIILVSIVLLSSCNDDPFDDKIIQNTSTLYIENTATIECIGMEQTYTVVTVNDRGEGTGTTTWTSDKTYILDGLVYVNAGQTLTIEPGTVIKGNHEFGEAAALIVARGARIIAEGTSSQPIIFTSIDDRVYSNASGICDESAFTEKTKGLWGGIFILGNSTITKATPENTVEGIPSNDPRALYGGPDESDDSGILRYVSIRYAGASLEKGAIDDINGLTLAGVGSGTIIDHVEVYACEDDGYKFLGGTVNTAYLVSAYCGDDAYDYEEGWRGKNQYWVAYQFNAGDKGSENDGGNEDCKVCRPYSIPVISNASLIGNNTNNALSFRDNAGGKFYNSIFLNYEDGIDIEYLGTGSDSYNQWLSGNLEFKENIMMNVSGNYFVINNETSQVVTEKQDSLSGYFYQYNYVGDASLDGIVPLSGGPAAEAGKVMSDVFFDNVPYKGALIPGEEPWFKGWTELGEEF